MGSKPFTIHLSGYFDYLEKIKRLVHESLKDYKCSFINLNEFLRSNNIEDEIYELKIEVFIDWMNFLRADGKSPKSVSKMISHVRGYLNYSWRSEKSTRNVLDGFYIKDAYTKVAPPVLTIEEVGHLIKNLPQQTEIQRKKRLIILMLYGLGLRTGELCSLNCNDINHEKQHVHIKQGKGGIQRIIPIPDGVWIELLVYLKKKNSGPLFKTDVKKTRVRIADVGNIVKEATLLAGLETGITPKTLRHTFASHLMDRGVSIAVISSLMGHRSPSETGVYLHSYKNRREESMNQLHRKMEEEL